MAIPAVDIALWDLKARLLDIPLVTALDALHEATPVYGSGGFTSYSHAEIAAPAGWLRAYHDHVRIEETLFDGVLSPEPGGCCGRIEPARDTA